MQTSPLDTACAEVKTMSAPLAKAEQAGSKALLALSLLWHPEPGRAGQQALLPSDDEPLLLSRYAPLFFAAGLSQGQPLGHAGVSRSPLHLQALAEGSVRISGPSGGRMSCEINGQPLAGVAASGSVLLSAEAVDAGVILQLGAEVFMCLHRVTTLPQPLAEGHTLVGISSAMVRVRRQIAQVAGTDLPVLLLGETGTGKELVAQAIHAGSARAKSPMVSVNMAAMTEGLAVADLFGAARGAYTGAAANRRGLFAEAEGGTLFLDEIGDASASVQPMLLRVLENGEYRALGSNQPQRANVRLIAATDRNLQAGSGFNQPLLRRLEAFVIQLPPLRQRREDLGTLVQHLLEQQLGDGAWPSGIPPALLRALFLHDWPGNVRQLGHAVRRMVLAWRAGEWQSEQELLGTASTASTASASSTAKEKTVLAVSQPASTEPLRGNAIGRRYRPPAEVSDRELLQALNDSGWCLLDAAEALGVSRPSLYNLLDRHPDVQRAELLTPQQLAAAMQACNGGLTDLATQLCTPREALRRRLRSLNMAPP